VALVLLIAVDLIGLGRRFHPVVPVAELGAPSGVATYLAAHPGLYRIYTEKGSRDEPNRLLSFPVAEANGYSSLEPDRHQTYAARLEYAPNRLLDLFNARYYAVKNVFVPAQSFNLTSYDPRRPLLSSTGRNPAGFATFRLDAVPADSLRVVSTLRWSGTLAQGTPVVRLTATDAEGKSYTFHLLAGVHTSDWAWERPDLKGKVPHQLAPIARTWQQRDGVGLPYPAHYYYAELPLGLPAGTNVRLRRLEVQFLHPTAQTEIFGLSAYSDSTRDLEQLEIGLLEKYRRVYADDEVILYENEDYLPRAYLVPSAVVERPGEEILQRLAMGDFAPERMVILEEQFDVSRLPPPPPPGEAQPIRFERPDGTEVTSGPGTVVLRTMEDDDVRLEATARQPAMLFLADLAYPGWKAYVDGQETQIYRADYLFRSVFVPAGKHTVEFVYRPRSFRLGLLITLVGTAVVTGALLRLALGGRGAGRGPSGGGTIPIPGSSPPAGSEGRAVASAEGETRPRKGAVSDA
jgi:Bacterial membrane protein YfhO